MWDRQGEQAWRTGGRACCTRRRRMRHIRFALPLQPKGRSRAPPRHGAARPSPPVAGPLLWGLCDKTNADTGRRIAPATVVHPCPCLKYAVSSVEERVLRAYRYLPYALSDGGTSGTKLRIAGVASAINGTYPIAHAHTPPRHASAPLPTPGTPSANPSSTHPSSATRSLSAIRSRQS